MDANLFLGPKSDGNMAKRIAQQTAFGCCRLLQTKTTLHNPGCGRYYPIRVVVIYFYVPASLCKGLGCYRTRDYARVVSEVHVVLG